MKFKRWHFQFVFLTILAGGFLFFYIQTKNLIGINISSFFVFANTTYIVLRLVFERIEAKHIEELEEQAKLTRFRRGRSH